MSAHPSKSVFSLATTIAAVLMLLAAPAALAAPVPSKLTLTGHFGKEVDKTGADFCTAKEVCQPGRESGEAGGFLEPRSAAVNEDASSPMFGDVYISDGQNHRVQVLTSSGQFVSMFGWDVDQTKVETSGASQAERNVCTAESKDVCEPGVGGSAPGQFGTSGPGSIAVDPGTGDVYVEDTSEGEIGGKYAVGERVQEFTSGGHLMLEIGNEVNEATKSNICTVGEAGASCTAVALLPPAQLEEDSEPGVFSSSEVSVLGALLAVGGPEDLLYVGDKARIQKFEPSGAPAGGISTTALAAGGSTRSIAVNPAGDVFVGEQGVPGVHEYSPSGQLQPGKIDSASVFAPYGIAVDPHGNLAVLEATEAGQRGGLYSSSGAKLSAFESTGFSTSIAISSAGSAYLPSENEVNAYAEIAFPETSTCAVSDVSATSAKLCGEVNPDGVAAKGFFEYGPTPAFASSTPVLFTGAGETFASLTDELTGLIPNQAYSYRTAAEATIDGEALVGTGEEVAFHTAVIAPQIMDAPSVSYLKAASAVLNGAVNPEHTNTRYRFEYGPCSSLAGCPTVLDTPVSESSAFGAVPLAQELTGLVERTTYSYRLVADNEFEEEGAVRGGSVAGPESTFATRSPPRP